MFFASGSANGISYRTPLQLSGYGFGDANVSALQQALTDLSQAALRPLANPGPITGEVNDKTMQALYNASDLITNKLSTWEKITIKGVLLLGASSPEAKNLVAQHAVVLAAATAAATAEFRVAQPQIQASPISSITLPAVLLVVGALFIGYRLFFATPAAKQEKTTT